MGMVASLFDVPLSAIGGGSGKGDVSTFFSVYDGVEGQRKGRPSL